jgi:hypothetical protein
MDYGVEGREEKRFVGVVCTLQHRCNVVLLLSSIGLLVAWMFLAELPTTLPFSSMPSPIQPTSGRQHRYHRRRLLATAHPHH